MGVETSKIKYFGEGEDFTKYQYGLKRFASNNKLKPGLVLDFGSLDPLILLYVGDAEFDKDGEIVLKLPSGLTEDQYTHILYAEHEDGSINAVYFKRVTKEEAEKFMSIRQPPIPPTLPNFKYHENHPIKTKTKTTVVESESQTTAEKVTDDAKNATDDTHHDILSAIDEAANDEAGI